MCHLFLTLQVSILCDAKYLRDGPFAKLPELSRVRPLWRGAFHPWCGPRLAVRDASARGANVMTRTKVVSAGRPGELWNVRPGLRRMAGSVTRSHGCRSTPEVLARREIPARAVPWRFRFGDSGVKRNSLHLSGDRFRHNGPRYAGTWPSRDGQARRETDFGHVRNVRRDPCCGRPRCGFHVPRQAAINNGAVLREPVFPHNIFAAGYACSSTP